MNRYLSTLPFLQPICRLWQHALCRKLWRLLVWLFWIGYFGFVLIFLSLRYAVLPQIENYRGDIEQALSSSFNLPVTISGIDAGWRGLRPQLSLHGFQVRDAQGQPALAFDNVQAEVSWSSLFHFGLRLNRLEIAAPALNIRRDAQGRIFVAGLQINAQNRNHNFANWLLAQHNIVISDATITWKDELRKAPPLELNRLNFHLQNHGSHHRFGLIADPPGELSKRLDIRGDLRGDDLDAPETWQGKAYAELDYVDLAVWRTWVDYPLELPQGSGGMRLWLSFAEKQLTSLTADISLDNVKLRLSKEMPMLELKRLNGRLTGKWLKNGFEAGANHLALTTLDTRDNVRIEPTDFLFRRYEEDSLIGGKSIRGEFSANGLDLGALARLSTYIPFDAGMRQKLDAAAPQGKVFDLSFSWNESPGVATGQDAPAATSPIPASPASYTLRVRFERLGLRAMGMLPGFEGVSGSITGNEKGGTIKLASRNMAMELPAVFSEPRLELTLLDADAGWETKQEGEQNLVKVKIDHAAFENSDATGRLDGSYLSQPGGLGVMDISAKLTNAAGSAVWRYMPLVIGKNVRDWLQTSIIGGHSEETTLRLKGDLKRFPFNDGSGIFEVKSRFKDASLRYVSGWPQIDGISGDLEFVGKRMTIKASQANIYGVTLNNVKAEIADLETLDEVIAIHGKANGPTADFLRFIETSPVAEHIGHLTEDMNATGQGELDLKLVIPLRRLGDSKIDGAFQFANNKLALDPDVPPLTEANGRLQFTGDSFKAERIKAMLLGAPMTLVAKTTGEGMLTVNAEGSFSVDALRKQYGHPLLDHLSGGASWQGNIHVRRKNVELQIESQLQGISSSLPDPFNKSATEAKLLRVERKLLNEPQKPASQRKRKAFSATGQPRPFAPRDQVDIVFGNSLAARFVRRIGGNDGVTTPERGIIRVGEIHPLTLPEKGIAAFITLDKLDADFWRGLLAKPKNGNSNGVASNNELPLPSLDLKVNQLGAFGQTLNEVNVKASPHDGGWGGEIKSRELNGEITWFSPTDTRPLGLLRGRIRQFAINAASSLPSGASASEPLSELPGLDIEVDQFLLRGKPLGKLKLNAENHEGIWNTRFDINNEDGKLSGEGKWRANQTVPGTQIKFNLDVRSIGKILTRLGYVDAVRRGKATLEGEVAWNGSPIAIDYPSMSGSLKLDAANGQFNKLEPGVGRLLGILSLQSLPRRITLDFRDVFSEGFAFDSITGQVNIVQGIMETKDLQLQGPSAKVLMNGSVNLPQETQNLKVRVQPAVGESLAVGAMLAHPAAGAVAWLAQKILRDPLDQAFAFEYAISGTWADPKVEKLSAPPPEKTGDAGSEAKP